MFILKLCVSRVIKVPGLICVIKHLGRVLSLSFHVFMPYCLFQIPKEEHNQMLRILKETDPEAVDFLLRRKAAHHMR